MADAGVAAPRPSRALARPAAPAAARGAGAPRPPPWPRPRPQPPRAGAPPPLPAAAAAAAAAVAAGGRAVGRGGARSRGGPVARLAGGPARPCRAQRAARRAVTPDQTLKVAERYSSEDWILQVQTLASSKILTRIQSHLAFNTIFAVVVAVAHDKYFMGTRCFYGLCVNVPVTDITPPPLALLSTFSAALGLLLVFRTNAGYERWSAGYKSARELRHNMSQVRRMGALWMGMEDLEWLERELRPFPAYLQEYLAGGSRVMLGAFSGASDPRLILTKVGKGMREKAERAELSSAGLYAEDRMQGYLSAALWNVEEMASLVSIAVAREYSRHLSRFLTVYLCVIPFALVDLGSLMPPAVAIISWALLGIEEIGHVLEDPFNSPTSPLSIKSYLQAAVPLSFED